MRTKITHFVDAISNFLNQKLPRKKQKVENVEELWPLWIEEYTALKGWTDKQAYQRRMAFGRRYVFPIIGTKSPASVCVNDVVAVLELVMQASQQTHWKVLICMSQFFRWCTVKGLISKERRLPTEIDTLEPHLGLRLRQPGGHHPAIDWRAIPKFVAMLVDEHSVGSKALLFTILTASRVQSVTMARWEEIDFMLNEWNIPASHMKGRQGRNRAHEVPLSTQAETLLKDIVRSQKNDKGLIFSATGRELSSNALRKVIKKLDERSIKNQESGFRDVTQNNRLAVTHGFRAAFATWAQEAGTDMSVVEKCLAHIDSADKHNGAYRRGTLMRQRKILLQAWGDYCFSLVSSGPEVRVCPKDK